MADAGRDRPTTGGGGHPTLRSTLDRQVMTADTAEHIGDVKGIVLTQPPTQATALWVSGRAGDPQVVDWQHVTVGPDAVMIERGDTVRSLAGDEDEQAAERGRSILGKRVLDTRGFEHGTVDDLEIDLTSGEIVAVVTEDSRIVADRLRGLGSYALVADLSDR